MFQRKYSVVVSIVVIVVSCSLSLYGFPAPQSSQGRDRNRNSSIVFNVWEYARVQGPLPPKPPILQANLPPGATSVGNRVSNGTETSTPKSAGCAWAVASCCHATSEGRRNRCFDSLGCGGAWIDVNFCSEDVMQEAFSVISATNAETVTADCALKIPSCCDASNEGKRNRCFESLGCGDEWSETIYNLCGEQLVLEAFSST